MAKTPPRRPKKSTKADKPKRQEGDRQSRTSKRIDFFDENIRGGYEQKPEKYRAKRGFTDRIRILTGLHTFYGTNVQTQKGGFWLNSCAGVDSIEADDIEACREQCPLFKRGFDIKQRFVVLIHHISRKRGKRTKRVDDFLPWVFDPGKYAQLRAIAKTLPTGKSGNRIPLQAIEIEIGCEDETFQKMTMASITQRSQMEFSFRESWEKAYDEGAVPSEDIDLDCLPEDVEAYLVAESKREILAALKRAESSGSEDEFDEDDEPKSKRGKPRKRQDDDEGDFDIDDDEDEEGDEDFDEDEEEEKPRGKRGKGKKRSSDFDEDDDDIISEDDIPF